LVGVAAHALKAKFAAKFLKVEVVALRQRTGVSRVTRPSESAAMATVSLIVEQGSAPGESASFWFTMARMRPFEGSMTTAVPFMSPSASIAAWRTTGSSPAVMSPANWSAPAKELAVKRSVKRWRRESKATLRALALPRPLAVNLADPVFATASVDVPRAAPLCGLAARVEAERAAPDFAAGRAALWLLPR
jgi:hypothetical protein